MSKIDLKNKQGVNCARAENSKPYAQSLPGDVLYDLAESFNFYDKENSGYISIAHFRNILHNFGFHKL